MKATKLIALLLVVVMCFAIVACAGKKDDEVPTQSSSEKVSSSEASSSSTEKIPEPEYNPTFDAKYEVKDGATQVITLDKTKINTAEDITVTFDITISNWTHGSDCANGFFMVGSKAILRSTTGKGLHIYDSEKQTPTGTGTLNGEKETDPCIWKGNGGAGLKFTVTLTVNVDEGYLKVFLDGEANLGGRTRTAEFEGVDYSDLSFTIVSNVKNHASTPANQNVVVENFAVDFTKL